MSSVIYRFGRFRLDPARRVLAEHGVPLALASSTFDLIVYLVANADRAVGRDELGAAVWGRTDVSDTVLGQTVLKARRALGDDGRQQGAILTVPRFGYRWVMPLATDTATDDGGAPEPVATKGSGPAPEDAAATVAEPSAIAHATTVPLAPTPEAAETNPAASASLPDGTSSRVRPTTEGPEPLVVADVPTPARPAPHAVSRSPFPWGLAATVAVLVLAAIGLAQRLARETAPAPALTPKSATAPVATVRADSVLVLPARIDADASFQWLRLGVMDLVASRLREGGLATLPSETVLGALANEPDALAPGRLAADVLRTQVQRTGDGWRVALERDGADTLRIEASDADPIVAARRATDLWLVHRGRKPPPAVSAELEELLHRVRAATLADQFALARDLLDTAPPELRNAPPLIHRRAQLALREGDYPGVEAMVPPVLAQLTESDQRGMRAKLLVTLAAAELRQRKIDDARAHYGAAADLLADGSDPATRGTALLGRGSADALAERFDAAIADLGRARSELRSANDALGLAQVDVNLAQIARMRERPSEALPMLENARQRFRTLGASEEAAFATASLAEVQAELLDHEQALATLDTLWPPEEHVGNLRMRWTLVALRARLLFNHGRFAAAQALIDRVWLEADAQLDRGPRARVAALALQIAGTGDDLGAMQTALATAAAAAAPDIDPCGYLRGQRLRLDALRRAGRHGDAAGELARLETWAQQRSELACLRIGIDLARAAGSDWAAARPRYAAALAEAERLGNPEALVDVADAYVVALLAHGDLDNAEAVSGRVSSWAERDFRAAVIQAQVYGARGRVEAWRRAMDGARRLAGERSIAVELQNVVR